MRYTQGNFCFIIADHYISNLIRGINARCTAFTVYIDDAVACRRRKTITKLPLTASLLVGSWQALLFILIRQLTETSYSKYQYLKKSLLLVKRALCIVKGLNASLLKCAALKFSAWSNASSGMMHAWGSIIFNQFKPFIHTTCTKNCAL